MDVVKIKCPNCAAVVQRQKDEYFAKCPYCGTEVCFNEIKEEVQLGVYREQIDDLQRDAAFFEYQKKITRKYRTVRTMIQIIIPLLFLIGFLIFGYATNYDGKNKSLQSVGMVIALLGLLIHIFVLPFVAARAPIYNILSGKEEKAVRFREWAKMFGAAFLWEFLALAAASLITMKR